MRKTILITGSTDGIGLKTAKMVASQGHDVLLHGRNPAKVADAETKLSAIEGGGRVESYVADLSRLSEVASLAKSVAEKHENLDVLINNAGVYSAPDLVTPDGLDVRFAVNTIAPILLARLLLPLLGTAGRIVNLSSAAQSPVDPEALAGRRSLADGEAYAQSKLALTTWSRSLGLSHKKSGPSVIAVNPGSMLGSKMVKNAFASLVAILGSAQTFSAARRYRTNSRRRPASISTTIQGSLIRRIRMRSIHGYPKRSSAPSKPS